MHVIDTNILLYAADRDCQEHEVAFSLLERTRAENLPWYLTWGIIYEFLRVSTHPRVFRNPWKGAESMRFVNALIASPSLTVLVNSGLHAEILSKLVGEMDLLRGNVMHDAHTVSLMREYGIRRIYTRDSDFHRFRDIEVIDPFSSNP